MNKRSSLYLTIALIVSIVCATTVSAEDMMKTVTIDGLRVELQVLPAKPFFTPEEVAASHAKEGMLIMGGAKPIAVDAASHPNHHLNVHIFDVETGNVVINATVRMNFQLVDDKGKPKGAVVDVPVVVMQAIGRGQHSTHYGNNVIMPNGTYSIEVRVNGKKVEFQTTVSESTTGKMHMH